MEFEIKCHLGYAVSGAASFLFNVAVTKNSFQRIIAEAFRGRRSGILSRDRNRRPALPSTHLKEPRGSS